MPCGNRRSRLTSSRREFLRGVGGSIALGATASLAPAADKPPVAPGSSFLREYGFWEYTTPCAGGFESYDYDDYVLALDDMARAGMNSLLIMVKWFTTGYRSKLPYLDQLPGNRLIQSRNRLLGRVMAEAAARKLKVWLGACTSYYDPAKFGSKPHRVLPAGTLGIPFPIGCYDPDAPAFVDRGAEIFREILDEFPAPGGLMLEMESVEFRVPHRAASYNRWAGVHGRPPYDDPSVRTGPHWFDYQTASIIKATEAVEQAVRAKGFQGDLATINKVAAAPANKHQLVNIEMMRRQCPKWASINYCYEKGLPDRPMEWYMEAGVAYPKSLGMRVYYLGRGVMTWGAWKDRQRLERSWGQDVADVQKSRPHGFWWFGAGGKSEGAHTALSALKAMGYQDDVAARRALLKLAAPLCPVP